jgi:hypothetical protein
MDSDPVDRVGAFVVVPAQPVPDESRCVDSEQRRP